MSGVRTCAVGSHEPRRLLALIAVLAAVIGSAAACSPAQNGSVDGSRQPGGAVSADARVTMQRLPCYGTCPVYSIEITADGTVTFTGERYVDSVGIRTAAIAPDTVAALVEELVAHDFFDFADRYTDGAQECGSYHTDAPGVILTLRTGGRVKSVEHDHGCGGAPPALRRLQDRVDSVAGVDRWIGQQ